MGVVVDAQSERYNGLDLNVGASHVAVHGALVVQVLERGSNLPEPFDDRQDRQRLCQ